MTNSVERLLQIANNPMWADHCEVSKRTLIAVADEIEKLRGMLMRAEAWISTQPEHGEMCAAIQSVLDGNCL